MKVGNFDRDKEYEESKQSVADKYYTTKWGATAIKRHNYNTPEGKLFQRRGIDVTVTAHGRDINISEKFLRKDLGNIIIELRTDNKKGWTLTDESAGLCWFTPGKCFEINSEDLKRFAEKIESEVELISGRYTLSDGTPIRIGYGLNERNSRTWTNINAYVSWKDLKKYVKIVERSI